MKHLGRVESLLRAAGLSVVTNRTRSLDHAEQLAARAVERGAVAVAYGGDGLAGRVAAAVSGGGGVMGLLPGGRGNDFARATGIPTSAEAACAVIVQGTAVDVDLGMAGDRPFLGIASVGLDSAVSELANRSRLPLGRLVYSYSALTVIARWQPASFTVVVDDHAGRSVRTFAGWSVAVANSGVYGGGLRMAPCASLQDGLLDVVTAARTSKTKLLAVLPRMFVGRHLSDPCFDTRRGTRVVVDGDRPLILFADGEPVGELPVELTVRRAALRLLAPPGSALLRRPDMPHDDPAV